MLKNTGKTALRSREWLVDALFTLMEKYPLAEITISEIAAEADLDRRTFYRHFKTKEAVIAYYITSKSADFEELLIEHDKFDNYAIAYAFFKACQKEKERLKILHRQNLGYLLLNEMSALFAEYQKLYADRDELEQPDKAYRLTYHIGGFWNILLHWLNADTDKTPEQMAEIVARLSPEQI